MEPILLQNKKEISSSTLTRKFLLSCGLFSSVLYIFMNVICAVQYPGYDWADQTVSELSAIDAPTRELWVPLGFAYGLLLFAFGFGVWQSSFGNRRLATVGVIFLIDTFIGFFWPPMHTREVLAAGGGTTSDILHIAWTFIHIPLVMLAIGFGAAAFGKKFRIYSIVTLIIMFGAGVMTGIDSPNISKDLPTPWIGVWERIIIAVYMAWIVVLAIILLRKERTSG